MTPTEPWLLVPLEQLPGTLLLQTAGNLTRVQSVPGGAPSPTCYCLLPGQPLALPAPQLHRPVVRGTAGCPAWPQWTLCCCWFCFHLRRPPCLGSFLLSPLAPGVPQLWAHEFPLPPPCQASPRALRGFRKDPPSPRLPRCRCVAECVGGDVTCPQRPQLVCPPPWHAGLSGSGATRCVSTLGLSCVPKKRQPKWYKVSPKNNGRA